MEPRRPSRSDVAASEATTRFGELLDRVQRGEAIVITRHGNPVARLVPFVVVLDRKRAQAAAERLTTFGDREGIRLPDDVRIRDLIGGRG